MVRILLGSIMSVMLMGASMLSSGIPDCSLEVRSGDGSPVSMVGSGVPFQVIVVMRNCSEQPHVSLAESSFALLRRVSIQTRIINGNSSISYVYSARIDHTGSYEIGPARVSVSGMICDTNTCSIEVGSQEKVVGARFMMELIVDDTELYVGQETMIRVRVYSAASSPEVESLHMSKVDEITVGEFKQVTTGSEIKEGVKYRYKEFSAPLYAHTVGKFVIPAYSADIRDDNGRRSGFFFFSAIAPTKQIHSNTVSVAVRALPQHDRPYALIGDYHTATASVDPAVITVGQAIRYRITVLGTGNSALAKAPLLSDMPATCKYYDSAVTELSGDEGIIFEYIVQPRQAGTWEIPAQEIDYFNPATKKYHTLQTEPVIMTAQGGPQQQTVQQINHEELSDASFAQRSAIRYHPDLSAASPIATMPLQLPWFWYFMSIVVIAILAVVTFLYSIVLTHYKKNYLVYRQRYAFQTARAALKRLEHAHKSQSLHAIFVTLFADYYMIDPSRVTERFIREELIKSGLLSEDGLQSWDRFWHQIMQEQYGSVHARKTDKTIYAEARLWIAAFSKMGV